MKKTIDTIKEKRWIHYVMITIIGILISIPFIWVQVRTTDDGWLHLIRSIGLNNSIHESNFPYLVTPYICRDFGYSMMAFYPPIVTYIPYFLGIIANAFHIGIKLFASLTIIFSGIFMYNFINEATKNKAMSFLAAVIYMIFPYRLEVIYNRFAIGEFTAFLFIPIVFQGLYNLINGDKKKHFYIAIGAIGLLLSHTISTVFTAVFCIIYILFNIKSFFKKDVIIKCAINGVFILLITAFFTIPMLEFEGEAHYSIFEPKVMKTSGKYTQTKTIELWQLLKDKGEENGVSFVVGIPSLIMLCITILSYRYIDKKYKDFYLVNFILGIFSIFMCTKFFPWLYMPQILNNIQYPWRMVGFAMFFFTPVFTMNVYYLLSCIKKEKVRDVIYVLIIILLGIFTASRLTIYKSTGEGTDIKYENSIKENPKISHFSVNRDYLPYKAIRKQSTYLQEREDRVYILSGKATIVEEEKQGLNLKFDIRDAEKDTILELPYFFYQGYTVILINNEQTIELKTSESDSGFVQVILPNDITSGTITVEYTGTTLEKTSYIISLISLIGFVGYIVYSKKKEKHGECNERKI